MDTYTDAMSSPLASPPTTDECVSAIRTLYNDPDPRRKEEASAWLQHLQRSVHAWTAADQLLHAKVDLQSCYMAAQTMRTKIQLAFHELPADRHAALRDSLLEHVGAVDEATNAVIVTQLSLALADLVLQMPGWRDAVADLASRFADDRPFALLEVLVVLPEEVGSRQLRLGANRREEIKAELSAAAPLVSQFLDRCLASEELCSRSPQVRINLLRCLDSWLQLGVMPLQAIESNAVMVFAFQVLSNISAAQDLHEAATDCAIALVVQLEQIDTSQEWAAKLEQSVYSVIKSLEQSAYLPCVATEDSLKAVNYCRIFTELGESLLYKIVHNTCPTQAVPFYATNIFDSVLTCCGHPDYEIPDITFNLWYRLSEEVYQRGDGALTCLFAPYIERLIVALCRHCQMEPDTEGIQEEGEDFTEFRYRCFELVKDVGFIVGSANIFRQMFDYLKSVGPSAGWEVIEAALFIMSAVAKIILPSENDAVPQVLESILSMPAEKTHVAVRHTSIKLVGELGEWVQEHPQQLDRILQWLLVSMRDPKLSSEAATALQNVAITCRSHMLPNFEGLTQLLRTLDTFSLKPHAANGLIKGVVVILSSMPLEQVGPNLAVIVRLQLDPLRAILSNAAHAQNGGGQTPQQPATPIGKNSSADPVLYLDRLATIFRYIQPVVPSGTPHPCLPVLEEMWPVLSTTLETYPENSRVMERCCRTVRFAVRCIRTQAAPLLEPVVKQIVAIYAIMPHSCFLYLGSIFVDEFSYLPGCVSGLLAMLESFVPPTFALLQAENGLNHHPDTVDDFFRLNARFIQRCPLAYLQTNLVSPIVECALLSVYLEHRDANASVLKYLFDVLHAGRSKEEREDFAARQAIAAQIRLKYGEKLVDSLVKAFSVHQLPTYTFHDIGDVIYELMLFDRTVVCKWLEDALKALPTKKPNGLETVTRKQLVHFHKEVTSAESPTHVTDAIREFSRLWR